MQGPGFGYGARKLVGIDVVHADRVADPVLQERHALLSVAVFHGIRQALPKQGKHGEKVRTKKHISNKRSLVDKRKEAGH